MARNTLSGVGNKREQCGATNRRPRYPCLNAAAETVDGQPLCHVHLLVYLAQQEKERRDASNKRKLETFDDLLAACEAALEHIAELEDAWLRGAISERDGLGGTRSNRNAELRRRLQAAIAKAKAVQA